MPRSTPRRSRTASVERDGLIHRRVALLDRKKLGLGVVVFVQVKIARGSKQSLGQFEDTVRRYPEVQECHMLMGEIDFLLKVVTRDVASYEEFLRTRLSRLAAVGEVRSSMVLSPVKETTALPLGLVAVAGDGGE